MPQISSVKAFLKARKSGDTKTTIRLTRAFRTANQGVIRGNGALNAWVHDPYVMDDPLTGPVRTFLGAGGALSGPELDHIDDWPAEQKERVREKLEEALDSVPPRNVVFKWTVHNGDSELTDIVDSSSGDITIKFRSPWKFVKLHTVTHQSVSAITVNVNQPPTDNVVGP